MHYILLSLSPCLDVTQVRGHCAGSSPPLPTTLRGFILFTARGIPLFGFDSGVKIGEPPSRSLDLRGIPFFDVDPGVKSGVPPYRSLDLRGIPFFGVDSGVKSGVPPYRSLDLAGRLWTALSSLIDEYRMNYFDQLRR